MGSQTERQELLTVEEVVRILRCGRTTTNQLLWSGQLPSVKIGRRRLVRQADLERFLEAHQYHPGKQ